MNVAFQTGVKAISQSLEQAFAQFERALESLNRLLLENHLRTHVTQMFEHGGDERDQAVAELLKAFDFDGK